MKIELLNKIEKTPARGAWAIAVKKYAIELIEDVESDDFSERSLLNGADDWKQFSLGGSALIYDAAICARLCSASEMKRKKYGQLMPNKDENWLDCQARALFQAANLIKKINL